MPPKMRAVLTLVAVVTGVLLWIFRDAIGMTASPWLFFGLVAIIAGSIWLFPEVKNRTD